MNLYLKYIHYIQKEPWLLVVGSILVLLAGLPALHIQVNNNLEDWLPESSQLLIDKKQFIKDFGNDEMMFLLLTFPDSSSELFRKNTLSELTGNLSKIYGLEQVFMRYQLRTDKPAFGMGIKPRLKKLEALFFPILDPNCEMVYMKTRLVENFDVYRPALIDSVNTMIAQLPSSLQTDLTGSGVIFNEIDRLSNEETAVLFVICFVVILIILAWRLKNIRRLGIALLLFLLLFWPAWSMFGWLGVSVNMISMIVPILLVINFFAYILHLLNKNISGQGEYIRAKLPPIVFSGITTMIGFGSLWLSDMKVIYEFGLLTFSGVLVGLIVLIFVGIPLVFKLNVADATESPKQSSKDKLWKVNILRWLDIITPKSAAFISLSAIAILMGGILIFKQIKIDTNTLHFLPTGNSVRNASNYIETHFGAFNTVDFIISKKQKEILNNDDLKIIKAVSDSLKQLNFVSGAVTYGDWKPLLHWIASEDKTIAKKIASSYITDDKTTIRMTLRIPMGSANAMKGYLDKIHEIADNLLKNSSLEIRAVGYLPIYLEQIDLVVSGMLKSLAIALFFITLCMVFMVRNLKLGLLALIPNTFPLGGVALFMAWCDMPLDIATSVIASVIIGLVVDDTLHIIWAYKNEIKKGGDGPLLFSKMLQPILRPSTTTSLIFAFGFIVLALSEMRTVHDFGVLVSLAIVLGWIGDFIVFPAVLKVVSPKE